MGAPYAGHCNCGAVSAVIDAEPLGVRQCWCRQCQKIAGGGPTNNAIFSTDAVSIDGELRVHSYSAASGSTIEQSFCPQCGSGVMGRSSARPHFCVIRLGFLDDPHGLRPSTAIWTDEAPDWAVIDSSLENVAQQPAPVAAPVKPQA